MLLKEFSKIRIAMSSPVELVNNEIVVLDGSEGSLNNLSPFMPIASHALSRVYVAPYATKHDSLLNVDTLIMPDFMGTVDPSRVRHNIVRGVPDWVTEVLTPSKQVHLKIWADVGVPLVWVIDRENEEVREYRRIGNSYLRSVRPLSDLMAPVLARA